MSARPVTRAGCHGPTCRNGLLRRLWLHRRGVIAVEMALVTSGFLLPITAGLFETGQALLTQYRLSRGLHAGLMYAWAVPANANASSIQNAATAGFQTATTSGYGSTVVTPVATLQYYCVDPTTGIHGATQVTSGTACGSGLMLGTWVALTLSASIPTAFQFNNGAASWPLTVTGTVRIS